jgi:bifunctional UDP-N-acetylglucosamine pyrophosphorylase/glucosamine-1-phosphate N-acetyltransferase
MKHRTDIGENVFIGSNTMLVAPVSVGDNAMTASGSVITRDVEQGALALSRGQQTNKAGAAVRLMKILKSKKKQKDKGTS